MQMKKHWGGRVWRGCGEALLRRDPETGQDSLQTRGPTLPPLQTRGHVSSKNDSSQATSTQQGHRAGLCTLRGPEGPAGQGVLADAGTKTPRSAGPHSLSCLLQGTRGSSL